MADGRYEWTSDQIAQLRELWREGVSTSEIGRRMGLTKNAVVGKAHRLNLTGRPSPIRAGRTAAPPRELSPFDLDRVLYMVSKTGRDFMSTKQIAAILKCTKRDVAHAVDQLIKDGRLQARFERANAGMSRTARRIAVRVRRGASLPPPASLTVPAAANDAAPPCGIVGAVTPAPVVRVAEEAPGAQDGVLVDRNNIASPPRNSCCWPLWGNKERPTHRYCTQPLQEGRHWCEEHSQLGYSPKQPKREPWLGTHAPTVERMQNLRAKWAA